MYAIRSYYGFQVLAAFVNGLLLLALCTFIVIEAFGRLRAPEPMLAGPALAVASVGLIVNLTPHAGDNRTWIGRSARNNFV